MADTVADVLVRLGVDTGGLRAGFRDARQETARFVNDLTRLLTLRGGPLEIAGGAAEMAGRRISGPFGFLLSGIGGLFSALGGLFTRGARNAAREIRRAFEEIVRSFHDGSLALGEAIGQLEAQRAEAIRRLSGKKGGRRELERLLPELDRALAGLRERQRAIFEQFETRLELLRTGEAFRDVAADVRELLRQYRIYVDAGGDLARANEFLSRSLEELRGDAARQLAAGEARAIENALQLNRLLQQREDILADAAEAEARVRGRGVLARQRSVAQEKAAEIEAIRRRRDAQLEEVDSAIRLLQLKVDTEAQLFDLTRDRVALETRLLELRAREVEREAAYLAALRDVVEGIVPAAAGFSLSPGLSQTLNLGGVHIFVGEGATPAQARRAGEEAIEAMLLALVRERERLGMLV